MYRQHLTPSLKDLMGVFRVSYARSLGAESLSARSKNRGRDIWQISSLTGCLRGTYAILMPAGLHFSMHFVDGKRYASENPSEERQSTPLHPGCGILRRAIRGNIVSFPSQIPILLKQPAADMQWRMVLLFFVRGWSAANIAERFHVPSHRVWKLLNAWSVRAMALGHVQVIDSEAFEACCGGDIEGGTDRDSEEMRLAESSPVHKSLPQPFPVSPPAAAVLLSGAADGTRGGGGPIHSPRKSRQL